MTCANDNSFRHISICFDLCNRKQDSKDTFASFSIYVLPPMKTNRNDVPLQNLSFICTFRNFIKNENSTIQHLGDLELLFTDCISVLSVGTLSNPRSFRSLWRFCGLTSVRKLDITNSSLFFLWCCQPCASNFIEEEYIWCVKLCWI